VRTSVLLRDWSDCMPVVESISDLLAIALHLEAEAVAGWSDQERELVTNLPDVAQETVENVKSAIAAGNDPLGDLFCELRAADERRPLGAVYTPAPIVNAMLDWASGEIVPQRVIDPGCGSGRFLVAAGRTFAGADLIGIEIDPLAAILARAHLSAAGMANRAQVVNCDYRAFSLPNDGRRTLFVGNPPYVRHHDIAREWKQWLSVTAAEYGLNASQLSGLHVYFFLATRQMAQPGDLGIFITASEWLDVNYGRIVRELLLDHLGVKLIQLIDPTLAPFPGTATTAVITGFQIGAQPDEIAVQQIRSMEQLHSSNGAKNVARSSLAAAPRWSQFTRPAASRRHDFVQLGELFRVHRGQATGANDVWIANGQNFNLPPSVLYPAVTRAKDLIDIVDGRKDSVLGDLANLRRVIDLPRDLDVLGAKERRSVEAFLRFAVARGADQAYLALHRKPWWTVGLRAPAAILATYMARRPPVFVRNLAGARHINIAHGLYPREPLDEEILKLFTYFLNNYVSVTDGRIYAGGLTKFEPKEMERLLVPSPEALLAGFDCKDKST
jgi:adenine-specific DNA-methyltransferase